MVDEAGVEARVVGHQDVVADEVEELLQRRIHLWRVFEVLRIDVGEILDEFRHALARFHKGGPAFAHLAGPEADRGYLDQFVVVMVQPRGFGVEGHEIEFFAQGRSVFLFQALSLQVSFLRGPGCGV